MPRRHFMELKGFSPDEQDPADAIIPDPNVRGRLSASSPIERTDIRVTTDHLPSF